MKILAIDASTHSSGVAIFDGQQLKYSDCFTASSSDTIKRIQTIVKKIKELLDNNKIDKIILEEVLPGNKTNMKTHKTLMWLQAAIAFMVHDNFPYIQIEYVYPGSWRSICGIKTGRGIMRAELKKADIRFVHDIYGIDVNDDEADAIGIGHSYVYPNNNELNWE